MEWTKNDGHQMATLAHVSADRAAALGRLIFPACVSGTFYSISQSPF